MQDVVVTGIGLVAGSFTNPEALFDHIGQGGSLIREHPFHVECGFPNPASAFLDPGILDSLERSLPPEAGDRGPAAGLAFPASGRSACSW